LLKYQNRSPFHWPVRSALLLLLLIQFPRAQCDWNSDGDINIHDVVMTVEYILNPDQIFSAAFQTNPFYGFAPLTVTFLDHSVTGELIPEYLWDFGDNSPVSTAHNPQHIFQTPGNFTVTLTITADDLISTTSQTVVVLEMPEFDFCLVPSGSFTQGEGDDLVDLNHDYSIMTYPVTTNQYIHYLNQAIQAGVAFLTDTSVVQYYPGDEYHNPRFIDVIDLDDPDCTILWYSNGFHHLPGYGPHPVTEVSWFGAALFADFYGLSLPDDAHWEKAARGDTGWDYPWGDNLDGSRANYHDSGDPWDNDTTPVGFYSGQIYQDFQTTDSPSPYGAYDMAGNVWEWTLNWYDPDDFELGKCIRGGAWWYHAIQSPNDLRSWYRYGDNPFGGGRAVGFRCIDIIP